jgi:hypothetical protein
MSVTKLERPVRRIEFDHAGRTTIVEFDDRQISVRNKKWHIELGTSTRLLHHLSTTISQEFAHDSDAGNRIRSSWLWLTGAVVIYFSEYNASIPLLAPALLLTWLLIFLPNIRKSCPRWWLSVNDDFGMLVVRILTNRPDSDGHSSKHEAFVSQLRKAIELAKQKEYGLTGQA